MSSHKIAGDTAAAIAASIEAAVHSGAFGPAHPLPPIRHLAAELGVSPVTVASAYRQLHGRGLVAAGGRRGTRVRAQPDPFSAAVAMPDMTVGLVDLASGSPDPDLLPPLDQALRSARPSSRVYGEPPVFRPLASFAAGELSADGVPATSVTVLSGALDAIERLLREHVRPGDRVAVEDPTLPALLDLIAGGGFTAEPVAMDEEGPLPASLDQALGRGARAFVLTPRAQNPTGAVISTSRAADLATVLRRRDDVLVIENDAAGPVAGAPVVTVSTACARWAVVRTVSKFLGPDLRVAVVAGDALTIARVQLRHAAGMRWVSHLLQQLVLGVWSDPSSGRRLARASETYAQRRAAAIDALAACGVRAVGRSGFNIWIPVREETAAVQALARRGWSVAAGERFRLRSASGIRVTTSALAPEAARRFAADCAEAVRPSAVASA